MVSLRGLVHRGRVLDTLLLVSVLSAVEELCLGLAATVVFDAPPVASVPSEAAVLCQRLATAVVTVSSAVGLAAAGPAAGVCLGPGAPCAWPALLCAAGEGAWLLGAAPLLDALLPRACLPL